MKKLAILVKLQLSALFSRSASSRASSGRKRKPQSNFTIMLVASVLMVAMSFFYSYIMAEGFKPLGMMEMLLSTMMLATTVLTLFSAIARAKTVLYVFGDYDLMMSLPVSTRTIALSRLISFYLLDLLYAAAFLIPAGVIYGIYENPPFIFYPNLILLTLFVPLIPLAVGGLIGTLVSAALSKFKYKNALNTASQMLFVLLVMVLAFTMNSVSENMSDIAKVFSDRLGGIYPLSIMFAEALHDGNIQGELILIGVSLLCGGLFGAFVMGFFKPLCTRMQAVYRNRSFNLKRLEGRGKLRALYMREWKQYTSSTLYFVNTGFSSILLVLGILYVAFFGKNTLQPIVTMLQDYQSFFAPVLASVMAWLFGMSSSTCASISIEGKTLWLSKHLPIRANDWLRSKILVGLTLPVPTALIATVTITITLGLPAIVALQIIALLMPLIYFFTVLGLWINLKNNRFDWKNEVEVVKSGAPVLILMLCGMAGTLIPIAISLSAGISWLCYVTSGLYLIAGIALRLYIAKSAERLRSALG
ncbi:MAG: hypothetical protein Q4C04_06785 [Clostridia bacterium]|nr:hypothetical protein [Clostridia bacterium]